MTIDEFVWENRPIESDCLRCGPRPGSGINYGYTCVSCMGTGLAVLPLADLGVIWDKAAADTWLASQAGKNYKQSIPHDFDIRMAKLEREYIEGLSKDSLEGKLDED